MTKHAVTDERLAHDGLLVFMGFPGHQVQHVQHLGFFLSANHLAENMYTDF